MAEQEWQTLDSEEMVRRIAAETAELRDVRSEASETEWGDRIERTFGLLVLPLLDLAAEVWLQRIIKPDGTPSRWAMTHFAVVRNAGLDSWLASVQEPLK